MEAPIQLSFERFTKISIGSDATSKLKTIRHRTGLTPNILSRFALMLSLAEPGTCDVAADAADGMEFNAYTLFGQFESIICALVTERCLLNGVGSTIDLQAEIRSHINRGVTLMLPRVKSLVNLADLLPEDTLK